MIICIDCNTMVIKRIKDKITLLYNKTQHDRYFDILIAMRMTSAYFVVLDILARKKNWVTWTLIGDLTCYYEFLLCRY